MSTAIERIHEAFVRVSTENKQLRTDAERYRWLRQHPQWLGWDSDYRPEEIDKQVDAAISKKEI